MPKTFIFTALKIQWNCNYSSATDEFFVHVSWPRPACIPYARDFFCQSSKEVKALWFRLYSDHGICQECWSPGILNWTTSTQSQFLMMRGGLLWACYVQGHFFGFLCDRLFVKHKICGCCPCTQTRPLLRLGHLSLWPWMKVHHSVWLGSLMRKCLI